MLDLNEVKNQTHINSDEVTREEAAEISSAEKWAPHLSDGLDALERAIFKVEHQKWMQVLAKAWSDETFKERLMRDAPSALKEFGIKAPAGVDFRWWRTRIASLTLRCRRGPRGQGNCRSKSWEASPPALRH
jgi:hypothetical protein